MQSADKWLNEPEVGGQIAGMLSHNNIHRRQCKQLYLFGEGPQSPINQFPVKLMLKWRRMRAVVSEQSTFQSEFTWISELCAKHGAVKSHCCTFTMLECLQ